MGVPPFQRFVDDHGPAVHGFLTASVGRHEADDCWQETLIAALRAYPTLQHDGFHCRRRRYAAEVRGAIFNGTRPARSEERAPAVA